MVADTLADMAGKMDKLLGGDMFSGLTGLFTQMEWAEEEIDKAKRRHRGQADKIYHSFMLLTPTHELMRTEFVYRSHCRELLERVAAGKDTRPGTAAELCCALSETSLIAPLTDVAAGLYGRMWRAARFPKDPFGAQQLHHEALDGSLIDDAEGDMRRKLAVKDRTLAIEKCPGRHHGKPVACEYSDGPAEELAA